MLQRLTNAGALAKQGSSLLCGRRTAHGYKPPLLPGVDWDDHRYAAIESWLTGMRQTPDYAPVRAAYAAAEIDALRSAHRDGGNRRSRVANTRDSVRAIYGAPPRSSSQRQRVAEAQAEAMRRVRVVQR